MALNEQEQQEIKALSAALSEQPLVQESELKGIVKEMNDDSLDTNNFSAIDMKTRLHSAELSSIIVHDTIVSLGCLPAICSNTTRMKKRLAISLNGLGRKESVDIVRGEREQRKSGNFMGKLFGGGNESGR